MADLELVVETYWDEALEALRYSAAHHPEVAALAAALASRRRVLLAADGDWQSLTTSLAEEAATCAQAGVPMVSAQAVITRFVDALIAHAVGDFGADSARLAAVLRALQEFGDRAREAIRAAYASV